MALAKCSDYGDIIRSISHNVDALNYLNVQYDDPMRYAEEQEDIVAMIQLDLGALLQSIQDCERRVPFGGRR